MPAHTMIKPPNPMPKDYANGLAVISGRLIGMPEKHAAARVFGLRSRLPQQVASVFPSRIL